MKKVFKFSEIDCPVCAGKLEKKISKIKGVNSAVINFIALKLNVEFEDSMEAQVVEDIKKTVKRFDSCIVLSEVE